MLEIFRKMSVYDTILNSKKEAERGVREIKFHLVSLCVASCVMLGRLFNVSETQSQHV